MTVGRCILPAWKAGEIVNETEDPEGSISRGRVEREGHLVRYLKWITISKGKSFENTGLSKRGQEVGQSPSFIH